MNNLPYFFALLKKNIALWTLIATGSFSKIDTAHNQYVRMSPYALILKNYSVSKNDTFKEIWITSTPWDTHVDFTTSDPKYVDSMKYYFGTKEIRGSMSGGYTINNVNVHNSTNMLGPIDIGLDRKVNVFLGQSGEHEYKITLMLEAKNAMELRDRFMDSMRRADSAQYGLGPMVPGMPGSPKPFAARLLDSAMRVDMVDHRKLTKAENDQLISQSIGILDKAIKVDSTFLDAYELKFGYEEELKRYDKLIITGKKILKLSPGQPEIIYRMGECYELTGKIDAAKSSYRQALLLYDQQLSNLDKNNGYDSYEMSKRHWC
jgi:tetratricopeptide (TPR) repeat protein